MYHLCLCLWWGIARMKIIAVYELECAKRTEMLLIWMVFWLPNKMGWKIFGALIFFFFFEQYCDHTINEPSWPSGISEKCLDFPLFAGRAYRWWSFVVWHPPYKAPSSITFRSLTTAVHPQPRNPQAGRWRIFLAGIFGRMTRYVPGIEWRSTCLELVASQNLIHLEGCLDTRSKRRLHSDRL